MKRFDPWFVGFIAVMVAALSITSVGTFEFFAFILPPLLAFAATVVLAAGLPLLKFASVLDKQRARRYTATLWAFLSIELLAQYFKAQASFAPKVSADAALIGSDLALAAANGYASRILAFVFLASLPFVVVTMAQASADRLVRSRGWLRKFAGIRRMVARLRADRAAARAEVAPLRAEVAEARGKLVQYEAWLRQARDEIARERARPVMDVETAARLLVEAGAPETTIRGWVNGGRLRLVETNEERAA